MSYYNDFPHINGYDGDLGWLIHAYKRLIKDYETLLEKVQKLEDAYDNIGPTIDAAIANMQAQVNAAIADMQKRITELENELRAEISDLQTTVMEELSKYMTLILQLESIVSKLYNWVEIYVNTENIRMKKWVESKIEEVLFSNKIWNPVYGRMDDNKVSMSNTYDFASWGLPAKWLDAVGITAKELDDLGIKAGEYDTKLRVYLWFWWHRKNHSWEMPNPWTGEMDDPRHVLLMLIGKHTEGVTAQELDDAGITVDKLDESNTTAYDYDWTRGWFESLVNDENGGN